MNTINQDLYKPGSIIKRNLIPLTILLSFGFLLYACNEKQIPVSDLGESTNYSNQSELSSDVNNPVTIADYDVTFSRTYNHDTDQTTFSYNVYNVDNVRPVANDFSLELVSCEEVPNVYFPTVEVDIDGNKITWNQAIPASENERDYSITFEGNVAVGNANATINRGSLNETKTVPGPLCDIEIETYTIWGYVYVDANENKDKDNNELGIGNVTVELLDGNEVIYSQRTSEAGANLGFYEFTVIGGNYTVQVPENTEDESDFNEQLFLLWDLTTDPPTYVFEPINENKNDVDFGFVPDVDAIISLFPSGDSELNTEDYKYWRKQLRLAINSERTPGRGNLGEDIPAMDESTPEILEFLEEIEERFLLPNIFQFGSDKLQAAYDILQTPAHTVDQNLCVQLLTAELNILSGRGTGTPELDLAIAAFGEFFAAQGELCAPAVQNSLILNSVTETVPLTLTSSATISDSETLLRSFNGGGGGVGN